MTPSASEQWLTEKSDVISRTFDMTSFKLNRSRQAPETSPRKVSTNWLVKNQNVIEKLYIAQTPEKSQEIDTPLSRKIEQLGFRPRANSASAAWSFLIFFVPQFILPAQITSPILNKFPKISSLLENCLYCYYSAYFLTHLMLFFERKYIVKNNFISISILACWLKMVATVLSESNILYVHVLCATNQRFLKSPSLIV